MGRQFLLLSARIITIQAISGTLEGALVEGDEYNTREASSFSQFVRDIVVELFKLETATNRGEDAPYHYAWSCMASLIILKERQRTHKMQKGRQGI